VERMLVLHAWAVLAASPDARSSMRETREDPDDGSA